MAIFNCYVKLPEGSLLENPRLDPFSLMIAQFDFLGFNLHGYFKKKTASYICVPIVYQRCQNKSLGNLRTKERVFFLARVKKGHCSSKASLIYQGVNGVEWEIHGKVMGMMVDFCEIKVGYY